MIHHRIIDKAKTETRKIHIKSTALGGGLAIYLTTAIVLSILYSTQVIGDVIGLRQLIGMVLGGGVIMGGGILDDKYRLKARWQLVFPIIASLIIIVSGIGVNIITNPFGGTVNLAGLVVPVDGFGNIVFFADVLLFIWLMTMMFTTKLLDGLDGLVTGIVLIGAVVLFFLSLQEQWYNPDVAYLAIIFAGACLGFLKWNWFPAKIFLGEGGSLFAGFMLAIIAIMSSGKIAIALLVMGFPMLDMARVIIRRIQKHKPIFEGDNEHLHFKLLHSGLNQKQAVLLFYTISLLFGTTALFLQSHQQIIALLLLGILMLLISLWFSLKEQHT